MNEKSFFKTRMYITGMVTLGIWSLLAWNYYHGGVPGHHILARKDMPEISNWWGGLLLPLLTWFLGYRIQKRLIKSKSTAAIDIVYGFFSAMLFGMVLSAFFTFGNTDVPGYMLMALLLISMFLPVYRAECFLGFVIGMAYTFGVAIPILVASIFSTIGVILYLYLRPAVLFVTRKAWR
jgi:hypothetical protein